MSKTAYPFIWTECSEEEHEGNTVFVMLVFKINLTNIPCHYEFAMYLVVFSKIVSNWLKNSLQI